jgi:hypothetical protein
VVVVHFVEVGGGQFLGGEGQHGAVRDVGGVTGGVDDRVPVGAAGRQDGRIGDRDPVLAVAGQGVGCSGELTTEVFACTVGSCMVP